MQKALRTRKLKIGEKHIALGTRQTKAGENKNKFIEIYCQIYRLAAYSPALQFFDEATLPGLLSPAN
jgi:hypothetical protein